MPKVTLTAAQRRANALRGCIVGSMSEYGITPTELERKLNISRSTLCRRMNDGEFSFSQLVVLAKILNWTDDTVIRLLKGSDY